MPLLADEIRDRVDRYFAAWRALDAAAWSACFAVNATSHDPYGSTPAHGHAALKGLFHTIANALQEVAIHAQEIYVVHDRAAVLFIGQGIGKNGKPVEVKGIDVFEFNEAGQIQTLWAYWNPAAVLEKLRS
jgi:steroid delta-isomerase